MAPEKLEHSIQLLLGSGSASNMVKDKKTITIFICLDIYHYIRTEAFPFINPDRDMG